MSLRTRQGRRLIGGFVVLAAPILAVALLRRVQKPPIEDAPAYRQSGPAAPKVVIAEFSDFQCPACRAAEDPLRKLLALYGDVRLVFKHFPLERPHPWARTAAVAAECAGRQGRFWEFHHLLYDRQSEWVENAEPPARFEAYARELKLDLGAFDACRKDPATDGTIAADMKEGDERWVTSTPTFFINGRRFVGSRQLSTLAPLWIDKVLKR